MALKQRELEPEARPALSGMIITAAPIWSIVKRFTRRKVKVLGNVALSVYAAAAWAPLYSAQRLSALGSLSQPVVTSKYSNAGRSSEAGGKEPILIFI